MNIPARYATGYLGDIGVPINPAPMDFSAYLEVYLSGRWWAMDARHNKQRIGRIKQAIKDKVQPSLPKGVELVVTYDRSELIQQSVRNLREKLLELLA